MVPIVKPSTAATLECDMCGGDILHRRAWRKAAYVCTGCGAENKRRPAVRKRVAVTGEATATSASEITVVIGKEEVTVPVSPDYDADTIAAAIMLAVGGTVRVTGEDAK